MASSEPLGLPASVIAARLVDVAEDDRGPRRGARQRRLVAAVVAVAMGDRAADHLAMAVGAGEDRVRGLDPELHLAADEAEAGVPHENAGEQCRLAEDLEAVADAEHRHAGRGRSATARMTGERAAIAPERR